MRCNLYGNDPTFIKTCPSLWEEWDSREFYVATASSGKNFPVFDARRGKHICFRNIGHRI